MLIKTEAQAIRRVSAATLRAFLSDALRACGLNDADAATVASAMLEADLTGSDAHGVFRLAGYVRSLKRGAVNPRASIHVIERGPATALIDGDRGMGHVVMTYAANLAVELAPEGQILALPISEGGAVGVARLQRHRHRVARLTANVCHFEGQEARHQRHLKSSNGSRQSSQA